MDNMLVSIVVPIYNVQQYLEECIESVCSQTYSNIEIILVNDGSTDNSLQICRKYEALDSRVKLIDKENGGLSDARNCGFDNSTGEYVYFLDSDDYIDAETIEILLSLAVKEDVEMISFDGIAFLDGKNPRHVKENVSQAYIKQNVFTEVMKGCELFELQMNCNDYRSPVQMYFFKSEFLKNNSLKFYKGILHEDVLFTFMAFLKAEKAMHVPCAFYHRRMRANSIMGQNWTYKNVEGVFVALNESLKFYEEINITESQKIAFKTGFSNIVQMYIERYFLAKNKRYLTMKQYRYTMKMLKEKNYLDDDRIREYVINRNNKHCKLIINRYPKLKSCILKIVKHLYKKRDCEETAFEQIVLKLQHTMKSKKRIIILCVPEHGNLGDHAIAYAQRILLEKNCDNAEIVELPTTLCEFYPEFVKPYLSQSDIFVVCGGGWFGSLWRHNEMAALNILNDFKDNRIIIMPQTVYYDNDVQGKQDMQNDIKTFLNFTDFHVFVRNQSSYELIKEEKIFSNAKNIECVPDMVLSLDMQQLSSEKRKGVVVCLRSDVEAVLDSNQKNKLYKKLVSIFTHIKFISTNNASISISVEGRKDKIWEILSQIASAELVVTDRLHCMLFAAITGTPCVAFDNLTGKVSGVFEWIKTCGYVKVCTEQDDFFETMQVVLSAKNVWDSQKFNVYYRRIIDLIRN